MINIIFEYYDNPSKVIINNNIHYMINIHYSSLTPIIRENIYNNNNTILKNYEFIEKLCNIKYYINSDSLLTIGK
jgi:hypothetical protein